MRSFTVKDKQRAAISIGGAEHFGLPAAYARLREVNVYLGWFGPLARPMQAGALVGSMATKLPGVREALEYAGEKLMALATGPEPGTTPDGMSWVAAEAYDARRPLARRGPPLGRRLVRVHRRLHRLGGRAPRPPGACAARARSARSRRSGSRSSSAAARRPGLTRV